MNFNRILDWFKQPYVVPILILVGVILWASYKQGHSGSIFNLFGGGNAEDVGQVVTIGEDGTIAVSKAVTDGNGNGNGAIDMKIESNVVLDTTAEPGPNGNGGKPENTMPSVVTEAPLEAPSPPAVAKKAEPSKRIILFYAPWCGHCKDLIPIWNQLMAKYQNHPDVEVDKIDCVRNEAIAERYQIVAFPTILLFKNKTQIPYNGGRDPQSLDAFINSQ